MTVRAAAFLLAVCTAACATAAPSEQPLSAAAERSLAHVRSRPAEFGVTAADLEDVVVSSETLSEHTGVTHVYLQQRYRGIEIANALVTVNVGRGGALSASGTFFKNLAGITNRPANALSADEAIASAAKHAGVTLTADERRDVPAKRVYHPVTSETLRLAWQVEIGTPDGQHEWVVTVDAVSGALLHKFDRVVSDQEGTE